MPVWQAGFPLGNGVMLRTSVAQAASLLHHGEMECTRKGALAVTAMVALAMAASAQSPKPAPQAKPKNASVRKQGQVTHRAKVSAGEAASLERSEAGPSSDDVREENRGRLTSARLQHPHSLVSNTVYHGSSHATVAQDIRGRAHTAQLQTGQLTSRQRAHLQTKTTALHAASHSVRGRSQKVPVSEPAAAVDPGSPEIHLKKHNARMF